MVALLRERGAAPPGRALGLSLVLSDVTTLVLVRPQLVTDDQSRSREVLVYFL